MDQEQVDQIWARMHESVGLVYNQTSLAPLGIAALIVLGLATLLLPRRYSILPMVVMACFIPSGQRLVVFTLDFSLMRLLVLFGWARIVMRGEMKGFSPKTIDKVVFFWAFSGAAAYIALRHGSMESIIFKLGGLFDVLGMYFLFRMLIKGWVDLDRIVRAAVLVSIPVALFFIIEHHTQRNLFSVFGGVPEITRVREGKLRCQGAFSHPIAAGCFWAGLMPLMGAFLWRQGRDKLLAVIGMIDASVIVIYCASSTPLASIGAGLVAAALFPLRRSMRLIRWGVLAAVVGLHLAMKAPVWALIARVDVVGGSTGFHRYRLIDAAIHHAGEWWAFGTLSTAGWGHGLFDVANQYVSEAVRGGLLTLVLFIVIIALAFRGVGRLWRTCGRDTGKAVLAWALGVALFMHCMSFIALHYLDQVQMLWLLTLAIVGSLAPDRVVAVRRVRRKAVPLKVGTSLGGTRG